MQFALQIQLLCQNLSVVFFFLLLAQLLTLLEVKEKNTRESTRLPRKETWNYFEKRKSRISFTIAPLVKSNVRSTIFFSGEIPYQLTKKLPRGKRSNKAVRTSDVTVLDRTSPLTGTRACREISPSDWKIIGPVGPGAFLFLTVSVRTCAYVCVCFEGRRGRGDDTKAQFVGGGSLRLSVLRRLPLPTIYTPVRYRCFWHGSHWGDLQPVPNCRRISTAEWSYLGSSSQGQCREIVVRQQ